MATTISNPRDLMLALLGDILYVERRLAGEVLARLAVEVRDEKLQAALRAHLDETKTHVERAETAFRRLEAAPSAHLSRSFEASVVQHDETAPSIVSPALADVFHAHAAVHTEHYEIAAYTTLLAYAHLAGTRKQLGLLGESLAEEERALQTLQQLLPRLGS